MWGREGKGEKEDYDVFCPRCNTEFLIKIEKCTRCGAETIAQKERREILLKKVEEYKNLKNRRAERKKKWELWKKTEAMNYKKTATNYEKWEVLTESENEIEEMEKNQEPIVPEDDPKFAALKKDLDDRKAKLSAKAKQSDELKEKGNVCMRKKNYLQAVDYYTQALELTKANKYLWTNRALAHIKREDYDSAIDDCTKILEYCDVLENGYTKSRDAAFKAFFRRALGYKGKEEYQLAMKDVLEAKKLYCDDQGLLEFEKELEKLVDQKIALEEIKKTIEVNDDDKEVISSFKSKLQGEHLQVFEEMTKIIALNSNEEVTELKIQELKDMDYKKLSQISLEQFKNILVFFYTQRGLDSLKRLFKLKAYNLEPKPGRVNFVGFLHLLLSDHNKQRDIL